MPNAIIVHNTTELEIDSPEGQSVDRIDDADGSERLGVARIGSKGTKVTLEPGIYRVLSDKPIRVSGANQGDFEVHTNVTKDGWPDPPKKIREAADRIGLRTLIQFVAGKSIEKP